ncbi:TonB family protein [Geofilum sp. OHC36d9]|uniref:TonB family protein n=1 Tax=Geofilum sp. OHC36d9 TaxID=3458413 RepID=UPI004034F222
MTPLTLFLIKSTLWTTGFLIIYVLFLKNEKDFVTNRIFLNTGVVFSLLLPFWTIKWANVISASPLINTQGKILAELPVVQSITETQAIINWNHYLTIIYLCGIVLFLIHLIWQISRTILIIKKSDIEQSGSYKIIKSPDIAAAYSFFTYIFVNNDTPDYELKEIIKHEAAHIEEKHWLDIWLAETLRIAQWFNPIAQLYGHFMRQNHEYLADQKALQRTKDPARYKAALLNQLIGGDLFRLGHSFNYSLNQKRFNMMKKEASTSISKLKTLWMIPMMVIIIYACSQADESFPDSNNLSDENYVYVIDGSVYNITQEQVFKILTPDEIESQDLIQEGPELLKYGSSSTTGIVKINSKEGIFNKKWIETDMNSDINKKATFMIVEEMPEFPGGNEALKEYLAETINYPEEAIANDIEGKVYVQFVIDENGNTKDTKLLRSPNLLLGEEALRVIREMPAWTPGYQRGVPVRVNYTVPINFVL